MTGDVPAPRSDPRDGKRRDDVFGVRLRVGIGGALAALPELRARRLLRFVERTSTQVAMRPRADTRSFARVPSAPCASTDSVRGTRRSTYSRAKRIAG
jgi:hypothetical protein